MRKIVSVILIALAIGGCAGAVDKPHAPPCRPGEIAWVYPPGFVKDPLSGQVHLSQERIWCQP